MTQSVESADLGGLFAGPDRYQARSPWSPVPALAVTIIACLSGLLVGIVAIVLAMLGAGQAAPMDDSQMDAMFSLAAPAGVATAAATQLSSLLIIWLAAGYKGMRREVLQLVRRPPTLLTAIAGGLLLIAATGVLEYLMYVFTKFDIFADTQWLREGLRSPYWWGTVIIGVVLAPLWEELTFRGFLLSALSNTRIGFWGAGLVSNMIWTLLHWGYSWQGLLSVFVAGMVLTWIVRRTGTIWAPVAAHAIANAAALAFAHFAAP